MKTEVYQDKIRDLAALRREAIQIIEQAMGEYNYLHFPLRPVSWLKSFCANPAKCNYITKGNLELWSTDSLCELADYLKSIEP